MSKNSVFISPPCPPSADPGKPAPFDAESAWRTAFRSMFDALQLRDCTPQAILETMQHMDRKSHRLEDITLAARKRNIAANDETVRDCLRTLYKDGYIKHRELAGRHFFICPQ